MQPNMVTIVLSWIELKTKSVDYAIMMAIHMKYNDFNCAQTQGVHKHFFDKDARPRTNFNYPKK